MMVRDLRAVRPRVHTLRSVVDDQLVDFVLTSDRGLPVPVEFVQRMIDQPEEYPDFAVEPYEPAPEPDAGEGAEEDGEGIVSDEPDPEPATEEPAEPPVEPETEPAVATAAPSIRDQLIALLTEGGVTARSATPVPILIKMAAKAAREGKIPVERLEAVVAQHGGKTE